MSGHSEHTTGAARADITAPVSREIAVSDLERSARFYRDVLGFDVRAGSAPSAVEAMRGPARIELVHGTGSGRRAVFFQTDDVAAMHAAVARAGGNPSALEDVNWIKIRMFEVRDPDGHVLWFGTSFAEPDEPIPERMMRKVMPELPLSDVPAGVAYYRDVLGFSVNYAQDDIGVMDRDTTRVLLVARTSRHSGIGSCYFYVHDVDALHSELVGKGAHVQGEPVSQPWGLREFRVLDLEGNQLSFAQTFE